jgi:hypothetical protein
LRESRADVLKSAIAALVSGYRAQSGADRRAPRVALPARAARSQPIFER